MKSMKVRDDLGSGGDGAGNAPLSGVLDSAQSVSAQDSTDPVFVGAGDIASCASAQVTKLLPNSSTTSSTAASSPTTVFTTGDNAYENRHLL